MISLNIEKFPAHRVLKAIAVLAHLQGDGSDTHPEVITEFDQICAGIELENQNEVSWKGLVSPRTYPRPRCAQKLIYA